MNISTQGSSSTDTFLRNLSVSKKKWSELILEISSLCKYSFSEVVQETILKNSLSIIQSKEEYRTESNSIDRNQLKKTQQFFMKSISNGTSLESLNVISKNKLLDSLINSTVNEEALELFYQNFPSLCNYPITKSDLQEIIDYLQNSNNLLFNLNLFLILTNVIFSSENELKLSEHLDSIYVQQFSKSFVPNKNEAVAFLDKLVQYEKLVKFESSPRLIPISGDISRFSSYQINGKGYGILSNFALPKETNDKFCYFEALVNNKGMQGIEKSINVGWALKNIVLDDPSTLGHDSSSWVLNVYSGNFLHNSLLQTEPKPRKIETAELSSDVDKKIDEEDPELFGSLFSEDTSTPSKSPTPIKLNIHKLQGDYQYLNPLPSSFVVSVLLDNQMGIIYYFIDGKPVGWFSSDINFLESNIDITPIISSESNATVEINFGHFQFRHLSLIIEELKKEGKPFSELLNEDNIVSTMKNRVNNSYILDLSKRTESLTQGNCVLVQSLTNENLKALTFEISIKLSEYPTNESILFACGPSFGKALIEGELNEEQSCKISITSNGGLSFHVYGCQIVNSPNNIIKLNSWTHIAIAYNYHRSSGKGNITFHVDGNSYPLEILNNRNNKLSRILPKFLTIGGILQNPNSSINGKVSNVRIWSTARGSDKLISYMERSKINGNSGDLLLYLPCEEGSGNLTRNMAMTKYSSKNPGSVSFKGSISWDVIKPEKQFTVDDVLTKISSPEPSEYLPEGKLLLIEILQLFMNQYKASINKFLLLDAEIQTDSTIRELQLSFPKSTNLIFGSDNMKWKIFLFLIKELIVKVDNQSPIGISLLNEVLEIVLRLLEINIQASLTENCKNNAKTGVSQFLVPLLYISSKFESLSSISINLILNYLTFHFPDSNDLISFVLSLTNEFADSDSNAIQQKQSLSTFEIDFNTLAKLLPKEIKSIFLSKLIQEFTKSKYIQSIFPDDIRPSCFVSSSNTNSISISKNDIQIGNFVKRSTKWQFENEDGGEGSIGVIIDIIPNENSNILVKWNNGSVEKYRYQTLELTSEQSEKDVEVTDLVILQLESLKSTIEEYKHSRKLLEKYLQTIFSSLATNLSALQSNPQASLLLNIMASLQFQLFLPLDSKPSSQQNSLNISYDPENFAQYFENASERNLIDWNSVSWGGQPVQSSIKTTIKSPPSSGTILTNFKFDDIGGSDYVNIDFQSNVVDIGLEGDPGWSTVYSDVPLLPYSGIYKWYIRLRFYDVKSHFMVGVCTSDFNSDEFLGQDKESWGLSQSMDVFHGGRRKKFGGPDGQKLVSGTLLEIIYDSNEGNLEFSEITAEGRKVLVGANSYEYKNMKGMVLFPAFSLFKPGDNLSILTNLDEILSLTNTSSNDIKIASIDSFSSLPAPGFYGVPHQSVIHYVLKLVEFNSKVFADIFSENKVKSVILILDSEYFELILRFLGLVVNTLGNLTRWESFSFYQLDLLKKLLTDYLNDIRDWISLIRLEKNDSKYSSIILSNLDTLEKSLNQTVSLVVQILGTITELLVNYVAYIPLNDTVLKISNQIFNQESDFTSTTKISISLIKKKILTWIQSDIFKKGLKSHPNSGDTLITLYENQDSSLLKMFSWISSYDRIPIQVKGSENLIKIIHLVFLTNIYHMGYARIFLKLIEVLDSDSKYNKIESFKSIKPPFFIIKSWESAKKIQFWFKDMVFLNATEVQLLNFIEHKSQLLLKQLLSSYSELELHYGFLNDLNGLVQSIQNERLVVNENHLDQRLLELKAFFTDILPGSSFEQLFQQFESAAKSRRDGFKLIQTVIERLDFNHGNGLKSIFIDNISPILHGRVSIQTKVKSAQKPFIESEWYYLDSLSVISLHFKRELQGAFSSMVSLLVSELNSTSKDNIFYQYSLMNALALRISHLDHEILARANLFNTLHELLDFYLSEAKEFLGSKSTTANNTVNSLTAKRENNIISVCMKLFILMSLQIAIHNKDSTESSIRSTSFALEVVNLLRVKSGPITLSKSVFDILYKLLHEVSDDLSMHLNSSEQFLNDYQDIKVLPEANLIASEATKLLICVSKNPECLIILQSPKWIQLLLEFSLWGYNNCKPRCLTLLADILINIEPDKIQFTEDFINKIKLFYPQLVSAFENDSLKLSNGEFFVRVLFAGLGNSIVTLSPEHIKYIIPDSTINTFCKKSLTYIYEGTSLLRTLFNTSSNWQLIIESLMIETFQNFVTSTSSYIIDFSYILTSLYFLGGNPEAIFESCPVSVSNKNHQKIGIVTGFHESGEKVDVLCGKTTNNLEIDDGITIDESEMITTTTCRIKIINRYPIQKMKVSMVLFKQLLSMIDKLFKGVNLIVPSSEEQVENEGPSSFVKILRVLQSIILEYTSFVSLKAMHSVMTSKSFTEEMLSEAIAEPMIFTILQKGETLMKVGSLTDIQYFEEYLVGLLRLFESHLKSEISNTKCPAISPVINSSTSSCCCGDKSSKQDGNVTQKIEKSSLLSIDDSLVESLVTMGFPRSIVITALQLCSGDPGEALSYIMANNANDSAEESETVLGSDMIVESKSNPQSSIQDHISEDSTGSSVLNSQTYHYDINMHQFLPLFASHSLDSERLGSIFPGQTIHVFEEKIVNNETWYRIQFCDFDKHNHQATYGDEIYDIFVWVPKVFGGKEVVKLGSYEGDQEPTLDTPPGEVIAIDRNYQIIGVNGAVVRSGAEMDSSNIITIENGNFIHACEESFNSGGTVRIKIDYPVQGWVSKLFGLVKRVDRIIQPLVSPSNELDISGSLASLKIDQSKDVRLLPGLNLFKNMSDNLEALNGAENFQKSNRFFGGLQGQSFLFSYQNSKNCIQSCNHKRMRIAGVKGYLGYNSIQIPNTRLVEVVKDCMTRLTGLYARKLVLIFLLRLSRTNEINPTLLDKNSYYALESTSKAFLTKQMFSCLRLIAFRGDPTSVIGVEPLFYNASIRPIFKFRSLTVEETLFDAITSLIEKFNKTNLLSEFSYALLESIAETLYKACDIKFSDNTWTDFSYEDDLDHEILMHPNIDYLIWASKLALSIPNTDVLIYLYRIWINGLKSASMGLKNLTFKACAEILTKLFDLLNTESSSTIYNQQILTILQSTPIKRLKLFASKKVWQEMEDFPSFSRYLQSMISFLVEINSFVDKCKVRMSPEVFEYFQQCQDLQESVDTPIEKSIRFSKSDSYMQFAPQKEINGSWTVEFLLNRSKLVKEQFEPFHTNNLSEFDNNSSKSRFSNLDIDNISNGKVGLSGLLKLLLGSTLGSPKDMKREKDLKKNDKDETSDDKTEYSVLLPSYLLSSAKSYIKIQKGGKVFSPEKIEDVDQDEEFVSDESLCVAVGQYGSDEKVFDCVVPYDQWISLVIVNSAQTGVVSIYMNGELVDSQSYSLNLPLTNFGSTKPNQSFSGDIAKMSVWSYAKTPLQIKQDFCRPKVDKTQLKIHIRSNSSHNDIVSDFQSYFNGIKLSSCELVEFNSSWVPLLISNSTSPNSSIIDLPEPNFNLLEFESNKKLTKYCGVITIPGLGKGALSSGFKEIVALQYSTKTPVDSSQSFVELEGFIDWTERGVKTYINGKIQDGVIELLSSGQQVISGSPEKISWLVLLTLKCKIINGTIQSSFDLKVKQDNPNPLIPGNIRLDDSSLPKEVTYMSLANSSIKDRISVKPEALEGQYIAIYHIEPYTRKSNIDSTYGILANEGSLWVEWFINSTNGNIAFGFTTSDALSHPDASVDANQGTWTYSTSGTGSHGDDLFCCDGAEEGDLISMHINTEIGIIQFFKNYSLVARFDNILEDPSFKVNSGDSAGIRPFVSLVHPEDSVSLLGSKSGFVEYDYPDPDEDSKSKLSCFINNGCIEGNGLLIKADNSSWFGFWSNDLQQGLHIKFANITSEIVIVEESVLYNQGNEVHDTSEINLEEETSRLISDFYEFRNVQKSRGNTLFSGSSDEPAVLSPLSTESIKLSVPEELVSIKLKDTSSETFIFQTTKTSPLLNVFEAFAVKKSCPANSLLFKYQGIKLNGMETFSGINLTEASEIQVSVRSFKLNSIGNIPDPLEIFFDKSQAKYVIQVVYESGATVRNGIEIEESLALRTLEYGEVVEAFDKTYTSEGIGRFRISDGWVSEKLRGGSESPVVITLREVFDQPKIYKILRTDGARLRLGASLESPESKMVPGDTLVEVSEKKCVRSNDNQWVTRLHITSPVEYIGWVSDKSHLIEPAEVHGNSLDVAVKIELQRRQKIRVLRKTRKMNAISEKKVFSVVKATGKFDLSQDTFFLLKKNRFSDSMSISSDFSTVKYKDGSGGRQMVLGSVGFSHGVHYWEVEVKSANWGSVFIGVAPEESSGWNGFGFINYRATQMFGSETLYGNYFGVNDKIGVLLDMDRGTLAFLKDGEDFNLGKVMVLNMGVAYHNLRKISHKYASATALFPCFGMKTHGDELSIKNSHWISQTGSSNIGFLDNILKSFEIIEKWKISYCPSDPLVQNPFPVSMIQDMYESFCFKMNPFNRTLETRPGVPVQINSEPKLLSNLISSEILNVFPITVGTILNSLYGPVTILGTSGTRIWYSLERNGKKAWYWLPSELEDNLKNGILSISSTEIDIIENSTEGFEYNLTLEDFHQSLTEKCSIDFDAKLVNFVNLLCNRIDENPLNLNCHVLLKYFQTNHLTKHLNPKSLLIRYIGLCILNKAVANVLPLIDFNSTDLQKNLISTLLPNFSMMQKSKYRGFSLFTRNVFMELKSVIFYFIKNQFWQYAVNETTQQTSAPADEYERPDEIREISINRIQARNAIRRKDSLSINERLAISVFGQLMNNFSSWDDSSFRRSYVHTQDAGQARAFFVRFLGEGVDDQGGPYRAIFQSVMEEATDFLNILVPCPNSREQIGENRDTNLFNTKLDERIFPGLITHFGKIVGLACRHKILVPLQIAPLLWKALVFEPLDEKDLQAVDISLINSLYSLADEQIELEYEYKVDLLMQALVNAMIMNGPGLLMPLEETRALVMQACDPNDIQKWPENVTIKDIIYLIQYFQIMSQNDILQNFLQGLATVLPVELLSIFTSNEVEAIFCGESDIDIEILKKVTVYESVSPEDSHIQYFWKALENMDKQERSQFINFCSGRSRLPLQASDFPMNFKLTAPANSNVEKDPDNYLPVARTCFFSLSIPKYTSYEVCLSKLRYAIQNAELMDADFIDRKGTSGWENIN